MWRRGSAPLPGPGEILFAGILVHSLDDWLPSTLAGFGARLSGAGTLLEQQSRTNLVRSTCILGLLLKDASTAERIASAWGSCGFSKRLCIHFPSRRAVTIPARLR